MSYTPFRSDLNLIITGYVEPNKPRLGRALAERLGLRFVDVEEEIELKLGDSVANIRDRYGERRLKAIQDEVVDSLILRRGSVMRIGGSTLYNSERRTELLAFSRVICLVARLDAILRLMHIALGTRYHDPNERAFEIGHLRREWAVRKLEGITEFDATHLDENELLERIVHWWKDIALARG